MLSCLIVRIFSLCPQTVQLTPRLLGALTALSWVCTLPSKALSVKKQAATYDTHLTTTIGNDAQMPLLSTWHQSPDSRGCHLELALYISQLPINLVVVKPDLPAKQDKHEGKRSVFKLTAARKKIEWGPLISHCYSCYWKCILFTLEQLYKGGSSGLTNMVTTNKASDVNTEDITSKSGKTKYFSLSHTLEPSLRETERGHSLIPIGSNDMNALIGVCLSSGLNLADDEVPTVIHCLCLLLPEVCAY